MFFFYLNANPLCYEGLSSLCFLFNSIWLLFLTKCSCLWDLKHVWPHFPQNETGFRWERKGLATAEVQMELLKVRRRCHNVSDSLIFQSSSLSRTGSSQFLYEMSDFARSVQDSAFSCTKCCRFVVFEQVCPLNLLVLLFEMMGNVISFVME